MQVKYGAKHLNLIYSGGCEENHLGLKLKMFYQTNLLSGEVFNQIKIKKTKDWDYVYEEMQVDARALKDDVLKKILNYYLKKVILLNLK